MKINNTLKLSAETVTQRHNLLRKDTYVTGSVTEGVTGSVTSPTCIEEVVTSIGPNGCKNLKKQVVTASVTAVVTRSVTSKKEKNKKRRNSPCTP